MKPDTFFKVNVDELHSAIKALVEETGGRWDSSYTEYVNKFGRELNRSFTVIAERMNAVIDKINYVDKVSADRNKEAKATAHKAFKDMTDIVMEAEPVKIHQQLAAVETKLRNASNKRLRTMEIKLDTIEKSYRRRMQPHKDSLIKKITDTKDWEDVDITAEEHSELKMILMRMKANEEEIAEDEE